MDEEKLQEALNQVAAEQLRADDAERKVTTEAARASKAEAERDEALEKIKKLEKERKDAENVDVDALRRQIKVLTGQLGSLKTRLDKAESAEVVREKVKNRVDMETKAKTILSPDVRVDEMADDDLMKKVVETLHGVSLAGKDSSYIRARFDAAVESYNKGAAAIERVTEIANNRKASRSDESNARQDTRSARQRFLDREENAWKAAATRKTEMA